jgi:hypothetical protein
MKIDEMTVKEMNIIQSIFYCENVNEIIELIKLQPNMDTFFKSFLELNNANMV